MCGLPIQRERERVGGELDRAVRQRSAEHPGSVRAEARSDHDQVHRDRGAEHSLDEKAHGRRSTCRASLPLCPLSGLGDQEQSADGGERAKVVEEDARRDAGARRDSGEREREPASSLGREPGCDDHRDHAHASVSTAAIAPASLTVWDSDGCLGAT